MHGPNNTTLQNNWTIFTLHLLILKMPSNWIYYAEIKYTCYVIGAVITIAQIIHNGSTNESKHEENFTCKFD